jgi:site-specific DNA recombinase
MKAAPVGIYVRVSRKGDREDERFHSPTEQAERASSLATAKGFTPGPVFSDIDVSGATPPAERPAMRGILEAIDRGELAGIAAFSLDRLSREPAHGDQLVKRVTKAGGVILTPDIPEAIDSPTGEFTFGMLLQVAKLYRSQARARFASAQERAILAGIPVGRCPVGYRLREDRRLELDPETAPVVRELFERWTAGAGRTALARRLDEATGKTWSCQAVDKIIRNRLYVTGRLEYGEVVSEWQADPIVDEPLWHAAQRPRRRLREARNPDGAWLLTGLARCGTCWHSLAPRSTRGRASSTKLFRYYVCTNRSCETRPAVRASAPKLEQWVRDFAFQLLGSKIAEAETEAVDLAPLADAVAKSETRLEQALAPEAQDALGERWAATVKERRAAHEAALAALGEARQSEGRRDEDAIVDLKERWQDMTPGEQREALSLYAINYVEVRGPKPSDWLLGLK